MLRAIDACTALEARAAAAAGADGPGETAAADGDGETGPEEEEIDTEERGARSMAEWPGDAARTAAEGDGPDFLRGG